ncbi:MAG: hypothetical protein NTV63_05935, partial [Candidatus Woesearchaeota archaeon]|nr:hypothetical protein [Candidatus Woesearchaeota archaeon]
YMNCPSDCIQKINETTPNPSALGCGNSICDNTESYLNCPDDCPSGGRDLYCDSKSDGRCDPDCAKSEDPDCRAGAKSSLQKSAEDNTAKFIIAAIFGVLSLFFIIFIIIKITSSRKN